MAAPMSNWFPALLLLAIVCAPGINAINYFVINKATDTPGGQRFEREIGAEFAKQKMHEAAQFIPKIFRQDAQSRRQGVDNITLVIEHLDFVAYAYNNEIHVAHEYLRDFKTGPLRPEMAGVIMHEATHLMQWNGNGKTPAELVEGIADWVRLKSGLIPPHWVGPGKGDRWNMGYEYTARFLEYCNGLKNGFVADLNNRMKDDYSEDFFRQMLGKSVQELWKNYKAKYGNQS